MALKDELISRIRHDFRTIDKETLVIPDHDKENFWIWFQEQALQYSSDKIVSNNIEEWITPSACFENSQNISLKKNLKYVEGFVFVKDDYTLHAFNILDGKVADYTLSNDPISFYDRDGQLPSEYYGIEIPTSFFEKNILNEPLLYSYFKDQIS
jgi:hypothetical protein